MDFSQKMALMYGAAGEAFVRELPQRIADLSQKWGLSDLKPFPNLSYNYVCAGLRGTEKVVLKIGFDQNLLTRERESLNLFQNVDGLRVLAHEPGAFLIERAEPGDVLEESTDAALIAFYLMRQVHQLPLSPALRPLEDVLKTLDNPWPIKKLEKARALRDQLLATTPRQVLLHGDLHHFNILSHQGGYVMIDPQGLVGDPCYDVIAFMRNPMPQFLDDEDRALAITKHRLALFSTGLKCSEARLWDWCFVGAVLCHAWALEDNLDTGYFEKLAAFFERRYLK